MIAQTTTALPTIKMVKVAKYFQLTVFFTLKCRLLCLSWLEVAFFPIPKLALF